MPTEAVRVRGLRELNRAFKQVDRDTRLGLRKELKDVAEPVRMTAESLATQRISNVGPMRARSWARMRIGVTTNVVYVAPKQRSRLSRADARYKRPRFGTKLMEQAMLPALMQHQDETVHRVERMLDRVADRAGF